MTKICGIYLITHIATGRKYVGQSIDIHKRWTVHSRGKCKMRLGNAIALYGWSAFVAEIIEICDENSLNDSESKWVAFHDCVSPNGFNLTTGGGHFALSEESKQKMSIVRTGKVFSAETTKNMSEAQRNRSEEWADKLNKKRFGRSLSKETRDKIGASSTGRKHSAEAKNKMSAARKGVVFSPETRSKLSVALQGRVFSEESRAKMSSSQAGKKLTPESIAKRTATRARNRLLRNIAAVAA